MPPKKRGRKPHNKGLIKLMGANVKNELENELGMAKAYTEQEVAHVKLGEKIDQKRGRGRPRKHERPPEAKVYTPDEVKEDDSISEIIKKVLKTLLWVTNKYGEKRKIMLAQHLIERWVDSGVRGDWRAIQALVERIEGKPTQAIDQKTDLNLTIKVVNFADNGNHITTQLPTETLPASILPSDGQRIQESNSSLASTLR